MDGTKKLASKANRFFIIRKLGLTPIGVRGMLTVFK